MSPKHLSLEYESWIDSQKTAAVLQLHIWKKRKRMHAREMDEKEIGFPSCVMDICWLGFLLCMLTLDLRCWECSATVEIVFFGSFSLPNESNKWLNDWWSSFLQTGFDLNSMIFLVAVEKWHIWQKNSNAHIHKHMLTPIVNKQTNPLLNIIIIPWMWIQIPNMEFPHRFPVLWLPKLNLTLRESQIKTTDYFTLVTQL